ncbi:MAG: corrinoid protein [Anaerolineales bacterium]|jgi:5-methyltetrahydrofolate--homocysteine methyltransferase
MSPLETIYQAVLEGDAAGTQTGVQAALDENLEAERILKEGLIPAMTEVGRLFEENEYFVPEMLISARAMQSGLNLLKPYLVSSGVPAAGKVVIGTVKGDLHDIGKNLVMMMLEGSGFEIIDLGTDVSPQQFAESVQENQASILAMSALLTTTMPNMKDTIDELAEKGLRERVKVIVGGAPLTQAYADQIGADGFAPDASAAARLARRLNEA